MISGGGLLGDNLRPLLEAIGWSEKESALQGAVHGSTLLLLGQRNE